MDLRGLLGVDLTLIYMVKIIQEEGEEVKKERTTRHYILVFRNRTPNSLKTLETHFTK